MAPRINMYAGAPVSESINWDTDELLDKFDDGFLRLMKTNPSRRRGRSSEKVSDASSTSISAWRLIPYKDAHFPNGFTQLEDWDYPQGKAEFHPGTPTALSFRQFATPSHWNPSNSVDDEEDDTSWHFFSRGSSSQSKDEQQQQQQREQDEEDSKFYDHSFAIHECHPPQDNVASTSLSRTSFLSSQGGSTSVLSDLYDTTTTTASLTEPLGQIQHTITSLSNIPGPGTIRNFCAGTVVVNLIVGIISLTRPFPVQTRYGSREVVELIVGDETKSGFAITFWLSANYRDALSRLRRQDVIFLRSVALSCFRKTVHGNSLRGDLTKVHLMYRKLLDGHDVPGHYRQLDVVSRRPAHPQLEKTRRVIEWVASFVATHVGHDREGIGRCPRWEGPPNDSQ